jgi:hypothetical protein
MAPAAVPRTKGPAISYEVEEHNARRSFSGGEAKPALLAPRG